MHINSCTAGTAMSCTRRLLSLSGCHEWLVGTTNRTKTSQRSLNSYLCLVDVIDWVGKVVRWDTLCGGRRYTSRLFRDVDGPRTPLRDDTRAYLVRSHQ